MAETQQLHPSILWAQRSDTVLLTVNLNDIHHEKYSLEEKVFQFTGVGGASGEHYNVELQFFKDVVPQESKHKKTARGLFFVIKKKDPGPYWPRLLSEKKRCPYVHTDFNRWKDEDESESDGENPYDDSSLNSLMQQMGGAGMGGAGMGGAKLGNNVANLDDIGESSSDSDDEPLPELES